MKLFKELAIMFAVYMFSRVFVIVTDIGGWMPIPVFGMILFLILLMTKVIKLESIEDTSSFILQHITFLFIPVGSRLIMNLDALAPMALGIFLLIILSTVITIAVTGMTVQLLNKKNQITIDDLKGGAE